MSLGNAYIVIISPSSEHRCGIWRLKRLGVPWRHRCGGKEVYKLIICGAESHPLADRNLPRTPCLSSSPRHSSTLLPQSHKTARSIHLTHHHVFDNTTPRHPTTNDMFDHYRSMPVVCQAEGCQETVVGEDAWCGWCRKVQCRRHYDSKAHGCRYTNLVSSSHTWKPVSDSYRGDTLRRVYVTHLLLLRASSLYL